MRYAIYALALGTLLVGAYYWPDDELRIDGTDGDSVRSSLVLVGAELSGFDRDLLEASYAFLAVQNPDDVFATVDGLTAEELIDAGIAAGKRNGFETAEALISWHFRTLLDQLPPYFSVK